MAATDHLGEQLRLWHPTSLTGRMLGEPQPKNPNPIPPAVPPPPPIDLGPPPHPRYQVIVR